MGDEFNTVDWGGLLIAADAFVVIGSMADFAIFSPCRTSFSPRFSTFYPMFRATTTRTIAFVLVEFVVFLVLR